MWYLLVAAGAGYLAQRWQNTHKARPLMFGCGENQRRSSPSSAPATPKRRSSSFSSEDMLSDNSHNLNSSFDDLTDKESGLIDSKASFKTSFSSKDMLSDNSHNVNSSFDDLTDKESGLIDSKASFGCFVPGSVVCNPGHQLGSKFPIGSSQDSSSSPQVVKSNKRSACEAFLIPATAAVQPIQGDTKGQFVSDSRPSLDFADIDSKEQLQEDSTSPSSCCSSNSTVINSPIGSQPILQKFGSIQFQGKESKQEFNVFKHLSTLRDNVAGSYFDSSPEFGENDASKGKGFTVSHYHHAETKNTEALQGASHFSCEKGLLNSLQVIPGSNGNAVTSSNGAVVTSDNTILDASTYRPHVFTGGNHVFTEDNQTGLTRPYVFIGDSQRGNSRPSLCSNDSMCTEKSKFEVKQGPEMATNTNREARSLLSSSHSVATESICDAESESLVSFGLAMTVFFMVSSGKREMGKMGKLLKETEDLVSDMRKELEERRARSSVSSLSFGEADNEELFTINTKGAAVAQVCTTEKTQNDTDGCCEDDLDDDESIRSMVTLEHVQGRLHTCDLEAELQFVDANFEGNNIRQKQAYCSNSGKVSEDSDLEEDDKDSLTIIEGASENDYAVSMIELERKLWRVFQERQEEKIFELEESLEVALSNLHAKEEELRWWKSRASWLMEHSFGSTSGRSGLGEIPMEDRVNRVGRVNYTDELINSMKECDAGENRSLVNQRSFLAVEGCIEVVENEGCLLTNCSGHENQMVRIGSNCSISSEDSVLSFDVRTVTDSEYKGFIQPS